MDRFDARAALDDYKAIEKRKSFKAARVAETEEDEGVIDYERYRDLPSDAADGDADDRQNPPSVTSDGDAGSTGDAEDRQKATTANADGETEELGDGKTGEVDVAGPCWDRRASLPPAGAEPVLDGFYAENECFVPPFEVPMGVYAPPSHMVHVAIATTARFLADKTSDDEAELKRLHGAAAELAFLYDDHPLHQYYRLLRQTFKRRGAAPTTPTTPTPTRIRRRPLPTKSRRASRLAWSSRRLSPSAAADGAGRTNRHGW